MSQGPLPSLSGSNTQPTRQLVRWGRSLSIIAALALLVAVIGVIVYHASKPSPQEQSEPTPREQFDRLVAKKEPLFRKLMEGPDTSVSLTTTVVENPVVVERKHYSYIGEIVLKWDIPTKLMANGPIQRTDQNFIMRYRYSQDMKKWVWGYRDRNEFAEKNPFSAGAINANVESFYDKLEEIGRND
jgi:hypothetical protein